MKQLQTVNQSRSLYAIAAMIAGIFVVAVSLAVVLMGRPTYAAGAPTISSVAPQSAFNGSGDTIVISGNNFDANTTVAVNDVTAVVSGFTGTTLSFTLPVSSVVGPSVIKVQNADGTQVHEFTYIGSGPTISSATPSTGPLAGGQDVRINGSGFFYGLHFERIATGSSHSCGISRGKVYCWGSNSFGQLGNGTTISSGVPVQVVTSGVLAGKVVTEVSVGASATVVLTSDNQLYSWGLGSNGALGNGSNANSFEPVAVTMSGVLAGKTIAYMTPQFSSSFAVVTTEGLVYAWGANDTAQLGDGSTNARNTPVAVNAAGVLSGKFITRVAAGTGHMLAVDSNGAVYSWGRNNNGQLGDNSTTQRTTPVAVVATGVLNGRTVTEVSAGAFHSLALDSTGRVYSWGQNANGQLGDNSFTQRNAPVAVNVTGVLAGKVIKTLTTGTNNSIALADDGQLYGWGGNTAGILCDNTQNQRSIPGVVVMSGALAGKTVTSVVSYTNTIILTSDGNTFGCGNNSNNLLTSAVTASVNTTPVPMLASAALPASVLFGGSAVALLGQTDSSIIFESPAKPAGFVDVTVTSPYTQTVTSTSIYEYSAAPNVVSVAPTKTQVASGDTIVISGSDFREGAQVRIGASEYIDATFINATTLQVVAPVLFESGKSDIRVRNPDGQISLLRAGLTVEQAISITSVTPGQGPVSGGQTVTLQGGGFVQGIHFTQVEGSGLDHSCGISAGRVYCWGLNTSGQLGDGTTTNRLSPTPVTTTGVMAGKTIIDISLGNRHTVALASDGTIYTWGDNASGQLGNGTTTLSAYPVQVNTAGVLAGKTIADIEASNNVSLAVDSDGRAYGWGYNGMGQLGNGLTSTTVVDPVATNTTGALAGKKIVSISTGSRTTGAVTDDGMVFMWGYGAGGTLGNGTTPTFQLNPGPVNMAGVLSGKKLVKISVNGLNTDTAVVLDSKGLAYTWGDGNYGQLGNGTVTSIAANPVAVTVTGALTGKHLVDVRAGTYFVLALDIDGKMYSWGRNEAGQSGTGNTAQQTAPIAVQYTGPMTGKVTRSISVGGSYSFMTDTNGLTYGWGANQSGKLGSGSASTLTLTPVSTIGSVPSALQLSIGDISTAVASQAEGAVTFATPAHPAGKVDIKVASDTAPEVTLQNAYEYIAPPVLDAVSPDSGLASGGDTIVLTGANFSSGSKVTIGGVEATIVGQTSTNITAQTPVHYAGAYDVVVTDSLGQRATLSQGFTYREAQPTITSITPVSGPVGGGQEVSISGNDFADGSVRFVKATSAVGHSCALSRSGSVYCWGSNSNGQLGNNSNTESTTPVPVDVSGVLAGKRIVDIATGNSYSVAVDSDGAVYSWGYNNVGQLGNNSTTQSNVPVLVAAASTPMAGKKIVKVGARSDFTVALDSDGAVYAWGANGGGQLGNNSTTQSNVPVAVTATGALSGKKIVEVTTGGGHAVALDSDGAVYAWGANGGGQLGNNSTTQSNVPVAVTATGALSGKKIVKVAGGSQFSLALSEDGVVYSWGLNAFGQLGNSSTTQSNVPVAVVTSGTPMDQQKIVSIFGGPSSAGAISADGKAYSWGYNSAGSLGNGSAAGTQVTKPVAVTTSGVLSGAVLKDIQGSYNGTVLAVEAGGSIYGWGYNQAGELGDGTKVNSLVPKKTIQPAGVKPTVFFNGVSAQSVNIVNSSNIIATTPAGTAGRANVTVTNYDGQSAMLENAYEYVAPPTLTSISPNTGFVTGGDTAVLSGANFSGGSTVTIGGVQANIVAQDATSITITTPVNNAGTYDVAVTDSLGQTATISEGFTYRELPPVVTSITPGRGPANGAQNIVIEGQGLQSSAPDIATTGNDWTNTGVNAPTPYGSSLVVVGTKIYLLGGNGSAAISSADIDNPTVWTNTGKTLPGAIYGAQAAVIGDTVYLFGGFGSRAIYSAPVSDPTTWTNTGKLLPGVVEYGQLAVVNDRVYIFGGVGSNSIYSASISDPTTWVNTGKTLPIQLGYSQVMTVGNSLYLFGGISGGAGSRAILTAGVSDPTTWTNTGKLLPEALQLSQAVSIGSMLYLVGGMATGSTTTYTKIFAASASDPLTWTDTGKSLPTGRYISQLGIINGKIYLFGGYPTTSILSADVTNMNHRGSNKSWITNAPARPLPGSVLLGENQVINFQPTNDPQRFTATTPRGSPGLVDLKVTNYDGQSFTLPDAYEYVAAPTISSISPAAGSVAGGEAAYISGSNFTENTNVKFAGNNATTVFINATTLLVTVPASANPGEADVVVEDEFGQSATLENGYIYKLPAPTITTITPQYAKMSGGSTVTINGTGFVNRAGGGSWYEVLVGGEQATSVSFVNSSRLTATVAAHVPGNVPITVGGAYSESVTLQSGITYLPDTYAFTNPPRTVMATEPVALTIEARDSQGNPVISTSDTVLRLTSSSNTGSFARAISGEQAGWDYDTVVIPAGQSSVSFYYRDASSGTPVITVKDPLDTSATQQVTIGSRYKILVTGVSNPTQMGTPSSVTIQAVDFEGIPQADYRGTIHFSSNDGAALLPADYTFTANDRGRKTFINGVTMGTIGTWNLVVSDTADVTIVGAQENILVEAPASGTIGQLKFITPPQSFALDQTSGVITVQTQDVNGTAIPVGEDTTIYLRSTSTTGEFSSDGGNTWSTAPSAVTLAAGTSFKNVLYRDTTVGSYEIKASQQLNTDFGWQVATQTIVVGVGAPTKLGIAPVTDASIDQWVPIDVSLQDNAGNKVTSPGDAPVRVSVEGVAQISLSADGSNAAQSVMPVIGTGEQSVTVWARATSGSSMTITAEDMRGVSDDDAYETAARVIELGEAAPFGLVFTAAPSDITVHAPTAFQVSLRDQFGNIVSATEDTTITFESNSAETSFGLTSSGPWQPSQTVSIAKGVSTGQVYVRSTAVGNITVNATSEGLVASSANVRVVAGAYAGKLRFTAASPASVKAGDDQLFTVELLDAYGNPTVASETVNVGFGVSLPQNASWNGTSAVNATTPGVGVSVTVAAGQATASATYRSTKSGSVTLQAYDQARWSRSCAQYEYVNGPCVLWMPWTNSSMTNANLSVEADMPVAYVFTTEPQVVTKNTPSAPITVELRDQFGNAAHFDGDTQAALASSGTGTFANAAQGPYTEANAPFAAGRSTATFYYWSGQISPQVGDEITVSGNGMTAGTQRIRVIEGVAAQAVLDTEGRTTAVAGEVLPVTLRTQTKDDVDVVVLQNTTFTLSSTEGEFSLTETPFTPVSSVTLSAETSQRQLFYRSTVAGPVALSARAPSITPVDTELAVVSSDFYKLDYTKLPARNLVEVTKPSESMVATAYDEFGNVVAPSADGATTVALQSTKQAGNFSLSGTGDWNTTATTIETGATTTRPFYYRIGSLNQSTGALDDASVLGVQTITASAQNVLPATAELRVIGALATRIVMTSQPQSLRAGQISEPITVQLQNTDGTPAVAGQEQTINLSSLNLNDDSNFTASRGNDVFTLTPGGDPITSLTLEPGQSMATFYVMPQTAESHRIRASSAIYTHENNYVTTVSTTQTLNVVAGAASDLTFTTAEQTIFPDKASEAIKIAFIDQFGNKTTNETNRTITLQSSCSAGRFTTTPNGSDITSLTLEAGQNEATFFYISTAASAEPCEMKVSSAGLGDGTQNIVVREPVYSLAITSAQQTIAAGQTSVPIVVETRDRFGNAVPANEPLVVVLEALGGDYTASPAQQTIAVGQSTTQFTFRYNTEVSEQTPITLQIRNINGSILAAEQDMTIVPGDVRGAVFNPTSLRTIVGDYVPFNIRTVNQYGKRAPATSPLEFNLSTSAVSGAFYQRVGTNYQQVTSTTVGNGEGQSPTLYYRQTQTTQQSDGSQAPATISAQRAGMSTGTASVIATAKTLGFSTGSFSAQASAYTPIRVTVSSPLATDVTINLATTSQQGGFYSAEDESTAVTSAVIPAGTTQSQQLYYRQTSTTGLEPETLSASAVTPPVSVLRGEIRASFYVTQFSQLVFVGAPESLEQGENGTMTVEARDNLGNVVPFTTGDNGYCLYVNSSSSTAVIGASGNDERGCRDTAGKKAVYVGRYQTRVSFGYKDVTTGQATVTIANSSGSGGVRATSSIAITDAVTSRVVFERASYGMVRGDETRVGVRLMSAHDFPVNSLGQTSITLTSTSSSGRFYNATSGTWVAALTVVLNPSEVERLDIRYTDASSEESATLQASASGIASGQAVVRFGVGPVAGLVFKQAPTPLQRGQEGAYTIGFVDQFNNPAPALNDFCLYVGSSNRSGGIKVNATSATCTDVSLPGGFVVKALFVPAGTNEATFTYRGDVTQNATLTVSTLPTGGGITTSRDISVVDGAPVRVGVDPADSTLERGGVMSGRLVLYNAFGIEVPATANVTARLTSDFTGGTFALSGDGPWSDSIDVAVPAGSSAVDFLYQAGSEHLGNITLTSSAAADSLESSTATLEMIPGAVAQVVFATPERTTIATHPSEEMIVEVQNRYGVKTTTDSDLQLYVRSNSAAGSFATSPAGPWGVSTIKVLAGQSNASVYYRDGTVGSRTLTVRDKLSPEEGESYLIATQQHHIVEQVFSHFIVTNISSPTRTGVASSAVIFAVDSENYVVAGYDGTIRFSSDDPSAIVPAQAYTFRPAVDKGIHTFTNGIAFKTPGIKSVTVTDQNGRQGTQFDIEVLAGNSAPVQSVSFVDASDGITLSQGESSQNLMLQLRDAVGALTNAPAGGMPLRINSSSPTGQFSTDGTNWSSQRVLTVEEGLSFSTTPLYYRDTTGGVHTLTVSDWIAGVDTQAIQNGELRVTVNSIDLTIDQEIYSLDYAGQAVKNPYIFSRNKAGEAEGYVRLQGAAYTTESGDVLAANWTVNVGGNTQTIPETEHLSYQSPALRSTAGGNDFGVIVDANANNRTARWQGAAPVSPWRAAIGDITTDDTVLTGVLDSFRNDQPYDSPQVIVKIVGGVNQVLRTWQLSDLLANGLAQQAGDGKVTFRVPLRLFSGGEYTVVAQLSNGNGITAQDARTFSVTVPAAPGVPNTPGQGTVPGGQAGGGNGVISPETPGDTSSRPEREEPTPPREGAYEQAQAGLITRILQSPETPIRVAQSLFGLLMIVVVALLYQMYREWRHARFLMAIIRRDNETLANKDAFLQLASHHLRTPLTLLASSVDLINMTASEAVKQINQNVSTVVTSLRQKSETIIARTQNADTIGIIASTPDEKSARRKVYLSPVFWLPVMLSIVLTITINWMVQAYGAQTIAGTTVLNQAILILVGAVLIYTAARLLVQRKQRTEALQRSQEKAQALNAAKQTFARQVARELTDDIIHLNGYVQQMNPMIDAKVRSLLAEGGERLERLVARLSLLDAVYASKEDVSLANMEQIVDDALRQAQQQNPSISLARDHALGNIKTSRSSWFVSRLMQDIFTSLAPLAGTGVIKVDEQQGDKTTKLVITGPSSHDVPAEDLFSVYSRSDQESAGTYSIQEDDNRMHRLDLYLDRIIADELQATVSADRTASQTRVVVELPNL